METSKGTSTKTQAQTSAAPPVWSSETHRRTHYKQRELKQQQQQQLLLPTLLADLRHATSHWLQTKSDDCFQLLVHTCAQILQHGLLEPTAEGTLRLIEDFEFLWKTEQQQPPKTFWNAVAIAVPDFLEHWVERCLRSRCLLRCVQALVSDAELLDTYYQRDVAFLRQSAYAQALCVCLTAIQLDQSSLLSQLEPAQSRRRHRRTSSQPNFSLTHRLHVVQEEEQLQQPQQLNRLRRFKSLPCLHQSERGLDKQQTAATGLAVFRTRRQTFHSPHASWTAAWRSRHWAPTHLSGSSISTASSCSQVASPATRRIQLINCDDIKIWTDQLSSSTSSNGDSGAATPPVTIAETQRKPTQCVKRTSSLNSFIGTLFGSPQVYTSWYKKSRGQDDEATSVLDTFMPVDGRKLDKRHQQSLFEGVSMLDYNNCQAANAATAPWDIVGGQAGGRGLCKTDELSASCSTTPYSMSSDSQPSISNSHKMDNQSLTAFLQMSRYAHNNTELEKENAHFRISEACITAIEHVKWMRRGQKPMPARASQPAEGAAYSADADADALLIPYTEQPNSSGNTNDNNNSAEAVGLQLISRFNDQQLPKLGDLKWLVSEEDAPQQLLPLPKPQQEQQVQLPGGEELASVTRGTKTWAPPRQQIIFTEHAPASRSQLLKSQNYRCTGCGMHVTRRYQQHFRYCNYLGKYLCTGCHRNQLSAIPAKILQGWNFRSYAVCTLAYRLIEKIYTFPLFHVPDLNVQLYEKQKLLARARRRRVKLKSMQDFISTCRFATREQTQFGEVPAHITNDPDMWSMCDFVDVQNNSMIRSIEELIALGEQHVLSCVLCTGRAFVCEYCKSPKLIYPWQRKVQRCDKCGACAHNNCWRHRTGGICLRCQRLQGRQHRLQQQQHATNS